MRKKVIKKLKMTNAKQLSFLCKNMNIKLVIKLFVILLHKIKNNHFIKNVLFFAYRNLMQGVY